MTLTALLLAFLAGPPAPAGIDALLADHWRRERIAPAGTADAPTLLRRVMLDLAGRVPTPAEAEAFTLDRYESTVRLLIAGPEFAWHFGTVLDELIQGRHAGNMAFIDYARQSLRDRKGWDAIFRDVMVGPWTDGRQSARLFLERRARDLDVLTVDTTRAFFGVDISCARCHNHPLVKDWKRTHYYGMTAFLVRTTGGKGTVGEKKDGEAMYAGKDGKGRTVGMMFLSGKEVTLAKGSRREALVGVALEDKRFFARAFVNRTWDYFFGRGLVDPVDQMHSANPASVPALLDALADRFIASGYDIPRLVTDIVLSRAYRLDSQYNSGPLPDPRHFAVTRIRPLSPRQMGRSLALVLGDGKFDATMLEALDKKGAAVWPAFDPRTREFQSSTGEALFVANAGALRKWIVPTEGNLTARLMTIRDDKTLVRSAYRTILGRPPIAEELDELVDWLGRTTDRRAACEDVVWALAACAEFRFIR
jgi:hypothetical protein